MNKRISSHSVLSVSTPDPFEPQFFDDPAAAVDCLEALYDRNTRFLTEAFEGLGKNGVTLTRYRACYPQVSIETSSFGHVDSACPTVMSAHRASTPRRSRDQNCFGTI